MNTCDHGHQTNGTVKLLPIGGGGNVIVCHHHYLIEKKFRAENAKRYDPKNWTMPEWESLKEYEGAT